MGAHMKKTVLCLVSLSVLFCGCDDDDDFTWNGFWGIDQRSVRVLSDNCSCADELVDQLPAFEVVHDDESENYDPEVTATLCSGLRCLGVNGRFDGNLLFNEDGFDATGGFSSIWCSNTLTFSSNPADIEFRKKDDDTAEFVLKARQSEFGSCIIEISGDVVRQ